jgi:hypothetical protein
VSKADTRVVQGTLFLLLTALLLPVLGRGCGTIVGLSPFEAFTSTVRVPVADLSTSEALRSGRGSRSKWGRKILKQVQDDIDLSLWPEGEENFLTPGAETDRNRRSVFRCLLERKLLVCDGYAGELFDVVENGRVVVLSFAPFHESGENLLEVGRYLEREVEGVGSLYCVVDVFVV